MDQYKTSFIYLKLDAEKFQTFHCPRPIQCGISMVSLFKLLKTINNSDVISLYIEKDDDQNLGIQIENQDKKSMSLSKLRLLDIDSERIVIPDILFDSVYTMLCSDFQKTCRDLASISDKVNFHSNGDVFVMSVDGTFATQTIQIGVSDKEESSELVHIGEFKLKNLNFICKSSGLCPTIEIFLKPDFPIILVYSVAALGSVKFGLCPNAVETNN
jgi:proliferating cell nuclear antigen